MLYYQEKGEGSPIVLLHGYLENLKMWETFGNEFSKSYKIIAIDLPGHGHSKTYGEVHTMEFMAEKVVKVLDALQIEQAVLIGHSMGGYVTLALAELYPEKLKGFVLLNSSSLPDSEEKKAQRLKAVETARENLETLIKVSIPALFAEKNLSFLEKEVAFAKELAKETPVEGVAAALKGMRLRPDRTHILEKTEIPVGILIGQYDQAVNPEELEKVIPENPNIYVKELETGHMSHLEAPNQSFKFLQYFLKEVNWDN